MIHVSTELASNFTVGRYRELRSNLPLEGVGASWGEVVCAVRRRISEQFLIPIRELERYDKRAELPFRPGFAILALDCLLIDTIQSFREGRVSTGEVSPAQTFKQFLSSPRFADFSGSDRGEFFNYVRNGILHNGETRKDWKVRIDTPRMLHRDQETGTKTINRRLFHAAVICEWRDLLTQLRTGQAAPREPFLRRMDAIAGLPIEPFRHFYFAYGSNLVQTECHRTAPDAQPYGMAFLPGYKVNFTKHSTTRAGDTATIVSDPTTNMWGFVYRVHDKDKARIEAREGGYEMVNLTVYLVAPHPGEDPTPIKAFTFVASKECPQHCGPPPEYLDLVIRGANDRQLPEPYRQTFANLRSSFND